MEWAKVIDYQARLNHFLALILALIIRKEGIYLSSRNYSLTFLLSSL